MDAPCYLAAMNLLLLILILILLCTGGGFYFGGPAIGGGVVGVILTICLVTYLISQWRTKN